MRMSRSRKYFESRRPHVRWCAQGRGSSPRAGVRTAWTADAKMARMAMWLTQDPQANALLEANPLALLVGMLLDQQVPMEKAFGGPQVIKERFGRFDAGAIAEADPDAFAAMCSRPPAIHRFPGSMAKRVQELCVF